MATDEFWLEDAGFEIPCPKCGTEMVRNDDTRFLEETPERAVLECGQCGEISTWEISLQPRRARQGRQEGKARELPPAALPKGLRYIEAPTELVLAHRWLNPSYIVGLLLLASMALIVAINERYWILGDPAVAALVAGLVLLFLYGAVAQFRNSATINATPAALVVEHGPLPWSWPRRREMPLAEVVELMCTERHEGWFSLSARVKSGKSITLALTIPEDVGDFIARRVNWFIKEHASAAAQFRRKREGA